MLLWFEIKKYLLDYKKILFCLLSAAVTCVLLLLGARVLTERQFLFEPFVVGVVDEDQSAEFQYMLDFFSETVRLVPMKKDEAATKLALGEIPAYVAFPPGFAADVMSGVNTPFRFYGNNDMPLQLAVSKMLASGGMAFLSSSQSGIYATLDYAYAHGLSRSFVNEKILYPINVAFIKRLLAYSDFFTSRELAMTDAGAGRSMDVATFYAFMFVSFWFMVNLLAYTKTLRGYTPAVYARYRLAGKSMFSVQCIRLGGFFCLNVCLTLPLALLAAIMTNGVFAPGLVLPAVAAGLLIALCASAFGLMSAALFRDETACGLFIFLTALAMLFAAGGIVPMAYLPRAIHGLRYASVNHWVVGALTGGLVDMAMLGLLAVVFFGVMLFVEFLHTSLARKA